MIKYNKVVLAIFLLLIFNFGFSRSGNQYKYERYIEEIKTLEKVIELYETKIDSLLSVDTHIDKKYLEMKIEHRLNEARYCIQTIDSLTRIQKTQTK